MLPTTFWSNFIGILPNTIPTLQKCRNLGMEFCCHKAYFTLKSLTYEQYLQFKELANESDVPETSPLCCQFLQTKFCLLDGQLLCLKNKTTTTKTTTTT